ncbi:hypothetical protein SAMN05216323_100672 [Williamwhitmania taraxaci]|uniref:Uncharacterized protein n=2 Tax=Williamwhitmania taraxaci TaxID=1640674 RepID=A0A1G6H3K2_9BACT|nr:hypothetical protein SAMN05216323_100672 [Williamwhitmania taraxaci]
MRHTYGVQTIYHLLYLPTFASYGGVGIQRLAALNYFQAAEIAYALHSPSSHSSFGGAGGGR